MFSSEAHCALHERGAGTLAGARLTVASVALRLLFSESNTVMALPDAA